MMMSHLIFIPPPQDTEQGPKFDQAVITQDSSLVSSSASYR